MWNAQVRPHGEYFTKNKVLDDNVSPGVEGYDANIRIDASQGGTAIRMVVSQDQLPITVPIGTQVILEITCSSDAEGNNEGEIFARVYRNSNDEETFTSNMALIDYILPESMILKYPYIKVRSGMGDDSVSFNVDIFPHYISQPRR